MIFLSGLNYSGYIVGTGAQPSNPNKLGKI